MDRRGGRRLVEDGQAEARRVTDVAVLDPHPWPTYVGQHRAELKATATRAVDRAVAEGGGDRRALAGALAQVHVDAAATIIQKPTAFEGDVRHPLIVGIGLQVGAAHGRRAPWNPRAGERGVPDHDVDRGDDRDSLQAWCQSRLVRQQFPSGAPPAFEGVVNEEFFCAPADNSDGTRSH